jgi:2'-5' RNA ligase
MYADGSHGGLLLQDDPYFTAKPYDGLFFALLPRTAARTQLHHLGRKLRSEHDLHGARVNADNLHVTVTYLGHYVDVPKNVLNVAAEVATAVANDVSPFMLRFDRAKSFPNSSGNHPLVACQSEADSALLNLGRRLRLRLGKLAKMTVSQPHATLRYDQKIVGERRIEDIRWLVTDLVLIHSPWGRSQHNELGRWLLRGG